MTTEKPVLSAQAEKFLNSVDMYADKPKRGITTVRNEEGIACFSVPVSIDPFCLVSIVNYGNRQFELGNQLGRAAVKHELLKLIGAAPAAEGGNNG
jgi:hypothetical protein